MPWLQAQGQTPLDVPVKFGDLAELTHTLESLCNCLLATCHVNTRRTEPSTYQILSGSA